ncbi:MAG: hypothetical protein GX660_20970 [Clostridiaceae bacterium]|nr:hypothetical protein [Clostridiaceae bacterium]
MAESFITLFVGKRIRLYMSTWARFFGRGVVGVVANYKDGWIELKKKNTIEYIRADKIYGFKVME